MQFPLSAGPCILSGRCRAPIFLCCRPAAGEGQGSCVGLEVQALTELVKNLTFVACMEYAARTAVNCGELTQPVLSEYECSPPQTASSSNKTGWELRTSIPKGAWLTLGHCQRRTLSGGVPFQHAMTLSAAHLPPELHCCLLVEPAGADAAFEVRTYLEKAICSMQKGQALDAMHTH